MNRYFTQIPKVTHASLLQRLLSALLVVLPCVLIVGCGNGLATVTGQVTLNGQPLRGGNSDTRVTVQFQPVNGAGSTAIGLADENGNYELATGSKDGIPPGEYLVTCTATTLSPPKGGAGAGGSHRLTDPKYANANTSGLKFTVEPGKNKYDIPLVSSGGAARSGT